jgi:hypothetical protein
MAEGEFPRFLSSDAADHDTVHTGLDQQELAEA